MRAAAVLTSILLSTSGCLVAENEEVPDKPPTFRGQARDILGVVTNASGATMAGVNVALYYTEGLNELKITNATGQFLFESRPKYEHRVVVQKAGYATQERIVFPSQTAPNWVNFSMQSAPNPGAFIAKP